jgi:hypothetical protein
MNERCCDNANMHPLVGVKPNVVPSGEANFREAKGEHERARHVPAANRVTSRRERGAATKAVQ